MYKVLLTWHEGNVYSIHRKLLVRGGGIRARSDFDIYKTKYLYLCAYGCAYVLNEGTCMYMSMKYMYEPKTCLHMYVYALVFPNSWIKQCSIHS